MAPGLDDRAYSSRDVQDAAGLTRRQQNDWDGRGLLPHDRDGEEGWRRYTPREIFILMVCSEIRRQYGTPVERLKWLQDFMLQDGAHHFRVAVEMMATLGVGVWLLTDFEDTFIMDSELEFADLWEMGFFGAASEKGYVLVPLNALVNRLLSCLKEPVELEAHGRGHEIMQQVRAMHQLLSREEAMVLEAVRSKDFESVTVELVDGEVEIIRTTSRQDPATQLRDLLVEPYQTLTLTKVGGTTVQITQELTTKPKAAR